MTRTELRVAYALAAVALGLVLACAPPREPARVASYALSDVAQAEFARLDQALWAAPAPAAPQSELPEHVEELEGLCASLASRDAGAHELAQADLKRLGERAVAPAAHWLANQAADPALRQAAAQALSLLDSPRAALVLLAMVESSRKEPAPQTWLQAQCAWRLGQTTQDWVVPRLILCLRYEKDPQTVVFLARTLAHFGNLSGLDGLETLAREQAGAPAKELALRALAELPGELGLADVAALRQRWQEPTLPSSQPQKDGQPPRDLSPARQREVWRLIAGFSQWQLRDVDDGRFVLSRENAAVAPFLARALKDQNLYVRVHSAQSLERMGARGQAAQAQLIEALAEKGVEPYALAALARVAGSDASACERSRVAIESRLPEATALELRLAAVRALGFLGQASSESVLAPLCSLAPTTELAQAASEALLRLDPATNAAPSAARTSALAALHARLAGGGEQAIEAERALGDWLSKRAQEGTRGASPASPDDARSAYTLWSSFDAMEPALRGPARAAALPMSRLLPLLDP